MKKLLASVFTVLLGLFMFTTVANAEEVNFDVMRDKVEQTDKQIYEQIHKSIYEADKLILDTEKKAVNNLNGVDKNTFDQQVAIIKDSLNKISKENRESEEFAKEISKLNETIKAIEANIASTEKDNEELTLSSQKAIEANAVLSQELEVGIDKIIKNLLDVTNEMAAKLIEEGRKYGIEIISEWIPVEIGGRNILVDPLKVIGE